MAFNILSLSAPTSIFHPASTVSTHSVFSRRVMHGTPSMYASFCIPPESVRIFCADSISRIISRYPSGSIRRDIFRQACKEPVFLKILPVPGMDREHNRYTGLSDCPDNTGKVFPVVGIAGTVYRQYAIRLPCKPERFKDPGFSLCNFPGCTPAHRPSHHRQDARLL